MTKFLLIIIIILLLLCVTDNGQQLAQWLPLPSQPTTNIQTNDSSDPDFVAQTWRPQAVDSSSNAQGTLRLDNLRQQTFNGNSIAPQFAPNDSNKIAFTQQKYTGVYLLNVSQSGQLRIFNAPTILSGEAEAGFGFSWTQDGKNIVTRVNSKTGEKVGVVDVENSRFTLLAQGGHLSVPVLQREVVTFSQGNRATVKALDGDEGKLRALAALPKLVTRANGEIWLGARRINPKNTECWLPQWSPDETQVCFECWAGIYVYDIASYKVIFLDQGTSPNWSADSRHIVYEQTQDNGHEIIASELFMIDSNGQNRQHLSADLSGLARRPSLSSDGQQLAFDLDGNVFIADITEAP